MTIDSKTDENIDTAGRNSASPIIPAAVAITILADNKAAEGLSSEHGFSLWIETGGIRILFDTGCKNALEKNAEQLDIDLGTADILVLSHGHYDHTGGVKAALEKAPSIEIYCHPGIAQVSYSVKDGKARQIQITAESKAAIDAIPAEQIHYADKPVSISETVGITGPVPRLTGYEDVGGPFFLDPEGKIPAPVEDDLSLWIRTGEGLVICTGCSHSGIVNTIDYIREITGEKRIRGIIGGFHLVNASAGRVTRTIASLREAGPNLIVPCHCTGDKAAAAMRNELGEYVEQGEAGMRFSFPGT